MMVFSLCAVILLAALPLATTGWSFASSSSPALSRRAWMRRILVETTTTTCAVAVVASVAPPPALAKTATRTEMIGELEESLEKMKPIPDLLQANEWDKVRTILKMPPVNKLWNLGDSQNTLLQIAQETDNIELLELKDDLAYNLQLCDQLTYDNAFVYFQPGNGKVNIKEPQELAKKAMKQIQDAVDMAKAS